MHLYAVTEAETALHQTISSVAFKNMDPGCSVHESMALYGVLYPTTCGVGIISRRGCPLVACSGRRIGAPNATVDGLLGCL